MTRCMLFLIPALLGISFVIFALVVLASHRPVKAQDRTMLNGYELVDKAGNIRKPTDYRDRYQLLGTYTVPIRKGTKRT